MASTLDDILDSLTVEKGGDRVPNTSYNPSLLASAVKGIGELSRLNLGSPKGLEAYTELTGEKVGTYSLEQLELRKKARVEIGAQDFTKYALANFDSIVKDLDEETLVSTALKYTPKKDSNGENSQYNLVRKAVRDSLDEVAKIQNNPSEYFVKKLEGQSPAIQRYLTKYASEFLEIEKTLAIRNAQTAIQKYGAKKFLTDSFKVIASQSAALRESTESYQEDEKDIIEKAQREAGRALSATERAKAVSKRQEAYVNTFKENPDANMLNDLITDVIDYSTTIYFEKEAEEKAKKEANKKAKNKKK
jgi:hypothetical protein